MRYTSVRPSPDVIFRDLEGEAVLLDLASGSYFGLNAVATRVWVQLHEGTAVDGVIASLAEEFDADPDEIARDVDDLLADLVSRGLVIAGPAPPAPAP
jgi:Coenzyme PQQ synthesis protein D (PqqD)